MVVTNELCFSQWGESRQSGWVARSFRSVLHLKAERNQQRDPNPRFLPSKQSKRPSTKDIRLPSRFVVVEGDETYQEGRTKDPSRYGIRQAEEIY